MKDSKTSYRRSQDISPFKKFCETIKGLGVEISEKLGVITRKELKVFLKILLFLYELIFDPDISYTRACVNKFLDKLPGKGYRLLFDS